MMKISVLVQSGNENHKARKLIALKSSQVRSANNNIKRQLFLAYSFFAFDVFAQKVFFFRISRL